ncbi:MAG: hypothetical protein GY898_14830 [Proteobacteria bacterium]|nr:hypothetical protein [Pseudomonadota bacterium]
MDRRAVLLIAGLGLAIAGPAWAQREAPKTPDEAGILVDRIVAVVDDTPISASSVALEAAIRQRIAEAPDRAEFGRLLTETVDPLEAVIFRTILLGRPEIRDVHPAGFAAEHRLRLFEDSFGNRGAAVAWRVDWGLDKAVLLDWFRQSVILDQVIELAVDFAVTDEDERAYYERHKDNVYGGRPYEEVAADVAQRVFALSFEEEYNAWRTALRASVELRYIAR